MEVFQSVPTSALAIYAHPNDAELACGGTMAKWSKAGAKVGLVVVTAGDKGHHKSGESDLVGTRKRETLAACQALGIELVNMYELPDGDFENDKSLRINLTEVVRTYKPSVVLTHDPTSIVIGDVYVNHRDHRVVGQAVLDVVPNAVGNPVYPPGGEAHHVDTMLLSATENANVAVDISESLDAKINAMLQQESQIDNANDLREAIEARAINDGKALKLEAAEVFRRLLFS